MPPTTPAATRTVSRSSRHYAFPAAPSPSRALFPPDGDDTIWRLWCHAIGELIRRLLPPAETSRQPPSRQTQVHQMARQTIPSPPLAPTQPATRTAVSYTHLTLPTNREV